MPKSDYVTFDFYNCISSGQGAHTGFAVPGGSDVVAAPSRGAAPGVETELISNLIAALYEVASAPESWKAFLELLRSSACGNYASLIVRDPHGDNVGWVISASGGRVNVISHDPYAHWSPFLGVAKSG